MANINFIMQECSMPFEMPLGDFVSQALETNEDAFGALLKKRTKADILTYLESNSVTLSDLKELLEDILERLNKPHELIKDVNLKIGAISLIENGAKSASDLSLPRENPILHSYLSYYNYSLCNQKIII